MNSQDFCSERLITARSALGLSVSEAAHRIDIPVAQYLAYEAGDITPSADMVELIAIYLGTSAEYLRGETDDPAPKVLLVSGNCGSAEAYSEFSKLDAEKQNVLFGVMKAFLKE